MKFNPYLTALATLAAILICPTPAAAQMSASASAPHAPVQESAAAPASLVEGKDYTVLAAPIPQQKADKVEVLEFFGYFCPHCAHFDPIMREHAKTFGRDTYLRAEHVVWQPEMLPLARLAAAVNHAHLADTANPAIYAALEENAAAPLDYRSAKTVRRWIAKQPFAKKLLPAFDAPAAQTGAKKMQNLTERYHIDATPTVVVGGKYALVFDDLAGSPAKIDALIRKVRSERHLPY